MSSTPIGLPDRQSGRAMVLFAAKSDAAEPPLPPDTARIELVWPFQRYVNKSSVSSLARSVPPDAPLPMVRPLALTKPVLVPVVDINSQPPVGIKSSSSTESSDASTGSGLGMSVG